MGKQSKPTQETRDLCAHRDSGRCVRCGCELYGVQCSLHHRRMRSHPFPGLHEPYNLIWLCGSGTTCCHGWVHEHQHESYEHGWLVHAWDDPSTVSVDSALNGRILLDDDGGYREVGE